MEAFARSHPIRTLPRRLRCCPADPLGSRLGLDVRLAATFRARLLGLAGLRSLDPGVGLLLAHTRSVHTLAMRFALDLIWLDSAGQVLRVDRAVPPGRVRACRRARHVLEIPAQSDARRPPATRPHPPGEPDLALRPRRRSRPPQGNG